MASKISGKIVVPRPVWEAFDRAEAFMRHAIQARDGSREVIADARVLHLDIQMAMLLITPDEDATWTDGPQDAA